MAFHWRHFFPTNVAHLISTTGSPAVDSEVANKSEFVAIMQAYGWCLVQQTRDIVAFGEVMKSRTSSLSNASRILGKEMRNRTRKTTVHEVLMKHDLLTEKSETLSATVIKRSGSSCTNSDGRDDDICATFRFSGPPEPTGAQ